MLVGMIIPGILVAFLGSLYYLLPRGSGSRVSYLATILLTEIMFLVMITQVVPQTKIVPAIAFMFLQQTILLIFITIAVLIIDKIQIVLDQRMQNFNAQTNTQEEEQKPLVSVNEDKDENLIQEDNTMVIKDASMSGKAKIIQLETYITKADKLVFYVNIVSFGFLTIFNLNKIYH